ncbi:hypothetical protein BS78_07G064900 [Paspalum vaginatum]|nr:hypothetical protein BS78_07G064900 [Paspalum vaginatum]
MPGSYSLRVQTQAVTTPASAERPRAHMDTADYLLSTAVHGSVPGSYARPESQRPRLPELEVVSGARVPAVDLACPDRAAVTAAINDACRAHGFFQVLNHGVDARLMEAVIAMGLKQEFVRLLPAEEEKGSKQCTDDTAWKTSTSTNVRKETVRNWRDYLRLHCYPLDQFVLDGPFREIMSTYCKEVRELGTRLYAAMMPGGRRQGLAEQEPRMAAAVNRLDPPCPAPDLTTNVLPPHSVSDPNAALTILLLDPYVPGPGGGRWVSVNPQQPAAGALFVFVGDQLRHGGDLSVGAAVLPREPRPRAAPLGEIDPDGVVPVHALVYSSDGLGLALESDMVPAETFTRSPSSYAVQVHVVDEAVGAEDGDPIALGAKAAGEEDGRNGRDNSLPAFAGIMAASLAVNAVAAGAITPVMAFGWTVVMFAGVLLAMAATVRGARQG